MTIPRLELTGAVILTKLVSSRVLKILQIQRIPITMWTDSSIVHTWINNHFFCWKNFVHNRMCYIHKSLPQAVWKFVPGKENPADCETRGLMPSQLHQHTLWWVGPPWLSEEKSSWPTASTSLTNNEPLEERSTQVLFILDDFNRPWDLINRYSSLTWLLRITSMCLRAVTKFEGSSTTPLTTPITHSELDSAKYYWIKKTQQEAFSQEVKLIAEGKAMPKTSPLSRLTPFLDSNELLRVRGRLQSALLSSSAKHPFILPRKSVLTSLFIAYSNLRILHGGAQITLAMLRTECWIIGRAPVRSHILKCIRCAHYRQKRAQQIMGQLPLERVTLSRPFLHSGVDYAGPFMLKTWHGRNIRTYKGYIALFVCLSTSAMYLELVTDYSIDAFLAAFKRFVGRQGICATLLNDCGTNFKGADSELKSSFLSSIEETDKLTNLLANDGTQWRFIPPGTPYFGGKWEAGVKFVKYHLRRVMGSQLLTYEEMNTLLVQIEAVLRLLCPLTEDPEDFTAITPAHFLIGEALATIPEPSLIEKKVSHLS